jgi:hypothetical protein
LPTPAFFFSTLFPQHLLELEVFSSASQFRFAATPTFMLRCSMRRAAKRRGFEETSVIKGLAHGMPASLGLWYLIYLATLFVLR